MQIGIVGTGSVGTALGVGFAAAGHEVRLGSRDPRLAGPEGVAVVDREAAVEHGEVVVLAVPATVASAFAANNATALAGKLVVDPTNEYPSATDERSVAERIAGAAPDATVVKAFNTVGAEHMTDPDVGDGTASMLVAGPDGEARETVLDLVADLGFDPVVAGNLSAAGRLEDLARLWIDLSQVHGRDVAFRLLRE